MWSLKVHHPFHKHVVDKTFSSPSYFPNHVVAKRFSSHLSWTWILSNG
jgi:hypothetical protein